MEMGYVIKRNKTPTDGMLWDRWSLPLQVPVTGIAGGGEGVGLGGPGPFPWLRGPFVKLIFTLICAIPICFLLSLLLSWMSACPRGFYTFPWAVDPRAGCQALIFFAEWQP